jgi:D-psicose/D-tagatose/L-ribulose 3-epimerase
MRAYSFSLCNEVLQPLPFEAQCRYVASLGYVGLEVAPFTLCDDPQDLTIEQARAFKHIAQSHGLQITGLHWLLVKPEGLSITSTDLGIQQHTRSFIHHLCAICAAMGGQYLVHGSPKQRLIEGGQSYADALSLATQFFAQAAQSAEEFGVTYCIEPLSADQTPLINTVEQAISVVKEINHPALKTMLDTSSAGLAEAVPIADLIDQFFPSGHIAHVQLNDPNRRGPGQGDMEFGPILRALKRNNYQGAIAIEPFDYQPDGPACAAHSIGYLKGLLEIQ